jgi:hypothetical protein
MKACTQQGSASKGDDVACTCSDVCVYGRIYARTLHTAYYYTKTERQPTIVQPYLLTVHAKHARMSV